MKTIRVVAAVVQRKQNGSKQIFATQRGYGEFEGGWEFPGGKIEVGETPQKALIREIKEELDADDVEEVLNRESGVYGISMVSVDFRDIEAEALAGGKHAKLALDAYHYSIAGYIAKCAVAMGGIDVLTFTAGVGEKSPYSRSEICKQLGIFGVEISGKANLVKGEEAEISSKDSKIKVYTIPTNEELMIARETMRHLRDRS